MNVDYELENLDFDAIVNDNSNMELIVKNLVEYAFRNKRESANPALFSRRLKFLTKSLNIIIEFFDNVPEVVVELYGSGSSSFIVQWYEHNGKITKRASLVFTNTGQFIPF